MSERLDKELVLRGIISGRERAKEEIAAGNVKINGKVCTKASTAVQPEDELSCDPGLKFVSRGGEKLAAAVKAFALDIAGKVCMDVGASTGGFTDCMLQNGAAYVYAVDVGTDQLVQSLREDARVCSMEQQNIRTLEEGLLQNGKPSFVASDVSFISLRLVLPHIYRLSAPDAEVVCLIKPQFEAGKEHLSKRGVVTDEKVRKRVCKEISDFAQSLGFAVLDLCTSPVTGPEGNVEYLLHLRKNLRVMLVPNMSKPGVTGLIPRLLDTLREDGYGVVIQPDFAQYLEKEGLNGQNFEVGLLSEKLSGCDLLIVAGGDGTIIEYSRAAADAHKPILGINVGRLGFLSGLEPDGLAMLKNLKTGQYATEHRRFLSIEHRKADGSMAEYLALNDLVVSNGNRSTIVDINIFCDGAPVNSYRADGVIVSSPTGSTAYALAAGGPIIHPEIDCFSVTPICPHSLANRAILFPGDSVVTIRMSPSNRHPMFVTCDGCDAVEFEEQDVMEVRLSQVGIDLLNLTGTAFYERINEKFR